MDAARRRSTENVPAPITALALFSRFASRQDESFSAKVIAALRNEFGGHAVKTEEGHGVTWLAVPRLRKRSSSSAPRAT